MRYRPVHRRTRYTRQFRDPRSLTKFQRLLEEEQSLPRSIARHQETLGENPDDVGTRYMLANCLYASGQVEEAQAEWQNVLASGNEFWEDAARQAQAIAAQDERRQ